MKVIERLQTLLGRKPIRIAVILVLTVVSALLFSNGGANNQITSIVKNSQVVLTTPLQYSGGQSLSLIGNVRAFSEAKIISEKAGRVVAVNVTLGQQVTTGQIIGSLENAAERASVLQAEGVYDAALAAAAQNSVGVDEAENILKNAEDNAVSTFQLAYNTVNGVIRNNIDAFFSNPNAHVPGIRIDSKGMATTLNNERVAYQSLLPLWQNKANVISTANDLESELTYAKSQVQRTIAFVDSFLTVFSNQDNIGRYAEVEIQEFIATFTGLRSTLIGVQSNIDSALSNLKAAKDGVRRAKLAAEGGTSSAADAQVKQAVGALRSAQANLAETIFRSPINGTVNSLSIRTGDFINSFMTVAVVANNNVLEIVTYISDSERTLIKEGDEVLIEGKYIGTVTQIAPAVDVTTGKTEVRIITDNTNVVNGDTVRITKAADIDNNSLENILVPLSAVKFDSNDSFLFVVENNQLVIRPVSLGVVRGGSVEIADGLSATDNFVKDARGLKAGQVVDIIN